MKIKILSTAIEDLYSARGFYEKQGEGLGDYFMNSLFSDIDSLALYCGIHVKIFGYHRMLSTKFPYAIYYDLKDSQIIIVHRVLDLRQDPKKIHETLQ